MLESHDLGAVSVRNWASRLDSGSSISSRRGAHDRPPDRGALLLPTRELTRETDRAVGEVQQRRNFVDPPRF